MEICDKTDPAYLSLKEKLSSIIALETSKPYEEINCGLVDECLDFLMVLEGKERLSKKEVKERIGKIEFKDNALEFDKNSGRKVRAKRVVLIAAIVAVIISLAVIPSIASEGIFSELLAKYGKPFIDFLDDTVYETEGIAMYNADDTRRYDTLDEMLEAEKLDMLYPSWLPEGIEISHAEYNIDLGEASYSVYCNSSAFGITVYPGKALPEVAKNNPCKVINGLEIYYFNKNDFYQCNFIFENNYYSVTADTQNNLFEIVENLTEDE